MSYQTEQKDESYFTQWHIKGIQNIKLVSLYSKLVSHEKSKHVGFLCTKGLGKNH